MFRWLGLSLPFEKRFTSVRLLRRFPPPEVVRIAPARAMATKVQSQRNIGISNEGRSWICQRFTGAKTFFAASCFWFT